MAPPNRVHISSKESSTLLAVSAFKSQQFTSISAAAKAYNIFKTTLIKRLNGVPPREDFIPHNKILPQAEEDGLVRDILQLDAQGLSPTTSLVREIVDEICKARCRACVGFNWANNFIKRTPALTAKLRRINECQRRLYEDPEIIKARFELVRNTINNNGIQPENVYNVGEIGFQIGEISASRGVTATDRLGKLNQIKPDTEWVTLIQGVCVDGSLIPQS